MYIVVWVVDRALLRNSSLINRFHVTDHYVRIVCGRYERYGIDGLKEKKPHYISDDLKVQVVDEYKKHLLSLPNICVKYDVSHTAACRWIHLYKVGGYELLTRRRPIIAIPMGLKKITKKDATYEELQDRVEYLEAENALLKKVKALVEERNAAKLKIGRKPSKN